MEVRKGKLVIFSAPSGAGKTTIVKHLLKQNLDLEFSISATSRAPRGNEKNGVDYYFISPSEFIKRADNNEFVEWEEVYKGTCYGTLKSEVERITSAGKNVIFDVDVVGGLNIKKMYGNRALSVFVQPPSAHELENRLRSRATDSEETILKRLAKSEFELSFADKFDVVVINDILEEACASVVSELNAFFSHE